MLLRKAFSWMLIITLIVTLFPMAFMKQAQAATTFFMPDDIGLANTSSVSESTLNRDNALVTTSSKYTITGTYQYVAKESMTVTIQKLIPSNGTWITDDAYKSVSPVTPSGSAQNRFGVNVLLYSGFNRVTFEGTYNNVPQSEIFYIFLEDSSYLKELKMIPTTNPTAKYDLNDANIVVLPDKRVTINGKAPDADIVEVNGTTANFNKFDSSFSTLPFDLQPGMNLINVVVKRGKNQTTSQYKAYYFDPTKRESTFIDTQLVYSGSNYSVVNNTPSLTAGASADQQVSSTNGKAALKMTLIVPYDITPFSDASTKINITQGASPAAALPFTVDQVSGVDQEFDIRSSDGTKFMYKMVQVTTDPFNFTSADTINYDVDQKFSIDISYGKAPTPRPDDSTKLFPFLQSWQNFAFKYIPGSGIITNVYLLPDYSGTGYDKSTTRKILLTNTVKPEITTGSFYVIVESNVTINPLPTTTPATPDMTTAKLLPFNSDLAVTNTDEAPSLTGLTDKQAIYKVDGFPAGEHPVKFQYPGGTNSIDPLGQGGKTVTLNYVSKQSIYIESLTDGQTISFDSSVITTPTVKLKGEFIGFSNLVDTEYIINNFSCGPVDAASSPCGDEETAPAPTMPEFDINLKVGVLGGLSYGRNTIEIIGKYQQPGITQWQTVSVKYDIFVVDSFKPELKNHQFGDYAETATFDIKNLAAGGTHIFSEVVNGVFISSPDIQSDGSKSYTSLDKYNILLEVTGATQVVVRDGSKEIFRQSISTTADDYVSGVVTGATRTYDQWEIRGSQTDAVVRLSGFIFNGPGTHTYTVQVYNKSGMPTITPMIIERSAESFDILSPRPTVDNRYVVNKNFVNFRIKASGADTVTINGKAAVRDATKFDEFSLVYVGLKPDKSNPMTIQVTTKGVAAKKIIDIYYTSAVETNAAYMEPFATKHSVFNKALELTFPKGTVLKSSPNGLATKYYQDNQVLFGIADVDGSVQKFGDADPMVPANQTRTVNEIREFTENTSDVQRFNMVSPTYWISGGVGESADKSKAATDGVLPYPEIAFPIMTDDDLDRGNHYTYISQERVIKPTQRGKLTLKFNPYVVQDASYKVTVFYFRSDGAGNGTWINLGGEVNTGNNTISVPFDNFGYYKVGVLRDSLNDIITHDWARNILEGVYAKGIMPRIGADFGAYYNVTRGEFVTLLVKALNIPLIDPNDMNQSFDDVPWQSNQTSGSEIISFAHIETAARNGIVSGLSERFFGVGEPVTRQQAATMIARAMELKLPANDAKLAASIAKQFTDYKPADPFNPSANDYDSYALPAIDAVSKAKIMEGKANPLAPGQKKPTVAFDPAGMLTRDQAAAIVVKILQKNTNVFPKTLTGAGL